MDVETSSAQSDWALRPWILAALGALIGLAIQQLVDLPESKWEWGPRLVMAAVLLLGVGGIAFGLAWQRGREIPAIVIALVCGAVSGGVLLWNGMPSDSWAPWSWQLFCGLVGSGFILVLFQAAQMRHPYLPTHWSFGGLRDWKRRALDYGDVHETIWTDAILCAAAGLFMGVVFLIAHLLAEMFWLVKIDLLRELLRKNWFNALLWGGSFAGGLGLLQDRVKIISALQHVAMIVLRVLAPVLAAGLVLFLAVLPFTGLEPLWATRNTTPLMLSASLVALFLTNAVIGDRNEEAAIARPLRWGAMALGLTLLPMVGIAAWSTGLRIDQHGLSPDRLWAVTFIVLGMITAVAYAVAIVSRGDWVSKLYRSNLHLAFILGGVALLLSTALISFERISTADQVGRLTSGKIKPVDFDYRGLWFDFGPPGKAAIRRLAKEGKDADVRKYAVAAQKMQNRWEDGPNEVAHRSGDTLDARLTIVPAKVPLDEKLRERLTEYDACGTDGPCLLYYVPRRDFAVAVRLPTDQCRDCVIADPKLLMRGKGDWGGVFASPTVQESGDKARQKDLKRIEALKAGHVELRTVEQRQLFIDGEAVGDVVPMENAAQP